MSTWSSQMPHKAKTSHMQDWSEGISLIVPTYKRPHGIKLALSSLMDQDYMGHNVEIIVPDNDPKASARDFVTDFAKTSAHYIHYIHVPEPGVSNARNGAMAVARGRFIIFLDDDMEAGKDWVSTLVRISKAHKAAISCVTIEARMPNPDDAIEQRMQPLFSTFGPDEETLITHYIGAGGSLIDRSLITLPTPVFDPKMNEVGGEDDKLFDYLLSQGAKIAWSHKARAYEDVPPKRANAAYIWKRHFAFGQGPTQSEADKGWAGLPGIVKWVSVGIIQTLMRAPKYWVLKALKHPDYITAYAMLAESWGKIWYRDGFSPKLYGENADA